MTQEHGWCRSQYAILHIAIFACQAAIPNIFIAFTPGQLIFYGTEAVDACATSSTWVIVVKRRVAASDDAAQSCLFRGSDFYLLSQCFYRIANLLAITLAASSRYITIISLHHSSITRRRYDVKVTTGPPFLSGFLLIFFVVALDFLSNFLIACLHVWGHCRIWKSLVESIGGIISGLLNGTLKG